MAEDMLLRKAEVQYVAELPLDDRTVDEVEARGRRHLSLSRRVWHQVETI